MASVAASRLVVAHSQTKAKISSPMPNRSACSGVTRPSGNGRPCVRFIFWSMSRSQTQLMVLAPPAASVPPNSTVSTSHGEGTPRSARTMAGTVVTSSSSMMRGLVSPT